MKAHVEWIVGVIRVGSEFNEFGDKYEASCTVMRYGDTALLIGMSGKLNRQSYQAIKEELIKQGIKEVEFDRMKEAGKQKRVKLI